MTRLILAVLLCGAGAAHAAPPAPPPADVIATERAFFEALPQFMPGEHTDSLKAMIADDLIVTQEGEVLFANREAWLAWRKGLADGRTERFQMLREKFWRDRAGRIVVEEFWLPYAKDIVWHPDRPRKIVAYTYAGGKLTRVDYLLGLDSISYLDPEAGR